MIDHLVHLLLLLLPHHLQLLLQLLLSFSDHFLCETVQGFQHCSHPMGAKMRMVK